MMKPDERVRREALLRLRALDLHENVAKEFEADGTIYYSEHMKLGAGAFGILYWVSNNPEWEKIIKAVEQEHGIFVYHCTFERTSFGDCLTMLFASYDEDAWPSEREDLEVREEGRFLAYAYTYNLTDPVLSEFGFCQFMEAGGGLVRTA